MTDVVSSQKAIAELFGVSKTAVEKSRRQFGDKFPVKHPDGYHLDELKTFARENSLWGSADTGRRPKDPTYNRARIDYVLERTAREKLVVENLEVERQQQLGNLLLADDVLQFYRRSVNLVMTLLDSLHDVHDRELPEQCPEPDFWPQIRERILDIDRKLTHDVASAMEEIPS